MPRVIGTGCSLGSLTAAYLAAQRAADGTRLASDFEATIAAHAHFKLAGEAAGKIAAGPASFAVGFVDALYALQSADLTQADVHLEIREMPETCGL
jgi:hydroxyethylthiazole kinase